MIAEAVEEAVGIGDDSRRRQRDQRADGGGRTFERKSIEQFAVHIGVVGGLDFQYVRGILGDGDRRGGGANFQSDSELDWDCGTHVHILRVIGEARAP